MKIERNDVATERMKDVQPGDSVAVHLAANLSAVLLGEILSVKADRLRLKVHGLDGGLTTDAVGCPGWDVIVPWSSVGFIRHSKSRIVDCPCAEVGS